LTTLQLNAAHRPTVDSAEPYTKITIQFNTEVYRWQRGPQTPAGLGRNPWVSADRSELVYNVSKEGVKPKLKLVFWLLTCFGQTTIGPDETSACACGALL
jgi:hypothetical protein